MFIIFYILTTNKKSLIYLILVNIKIINYIFINIKFIYVRASV